MEYTIGEVLFFLDGKYADLIGQSRIDLLRAFYRHEDLQGHEPVGRHGGGGLARNLTHDQVNWDTAGGRVTDHYTEYEESPQ